MDAPTRTTLPVEIRVEDLEPQGRRYLLPRRQLGKAKWVALVPIGFGLIGVTFAVGWIAPLMRMAQGGVQPQFVLVFAMFSVPMILGGICVPIAIGLAMLWGHSEIEVRPDTLRTIERVGLLRWKRTRSTNCIRRLFVENANSKRRAGTTTVSPLDKLAAIRIEWDGTKPWVAAIGYSRALLIPLAHDLSQQCRTAPADPFVFNATPPAPLEIVEVPETLGSLVRHEQLANSKIVMAEQPGGATFKVPSEGLLRGGAGIALADGQLSVLKTGLFGSKTHSWAGDELLTVRVGPSGIEVNDKPLMELQIIPLVGRKFGLLAGRDVAELEWLATRLREALGIELTQASTDGVPLLPDVDQQPAQSQVLCQQLPGAVTLSVPRSGLGRATLGYWAFAIFWNGFIAMFIVFVILHADGFLGVLFPMAVLGILGAAGVVLLGAAVHMTIRRADLAVAGGRLLVVQTGLLGKKRNEWGRDELAALRAGPSGNSTNNKPLMQLQIVPKSGAQVGLLTGRDYRELAWMATLLRHALDLPAESNEMGVEQGAS